MNILGKKKYVLTFWEVNEYGYENSRRPIFANQLSINLKG